MVAQILGQPCGFTFRHGTSCSARRTLPSPVSSPKGRGSIRICRLRAYELRHLATTKAHTRSGGGRRGERGGGGEEEGEWEWEDWEEEHEEENEEEQDGVFTLVLRSQLAPESELFHSSGVPAFTPKKANEPCCQTLQP